MPRPTKFFILSIGPGTPCFSNAAPTNATVGIAYSFQFTSSFGDAPRTFALTSGSLPTGLNMNAAGHVTGTPTTEETQTFTVQVTDNNAATCDNEWSIQVIAATVPQTIDITAFKTAWSDWMTANGSVNHITDWSDTALLTFSSPQYYQWLVPPQGPFVVEWLAPGFGPGGATGLWRVNFASTTDFGNPYADLDYTLARNNPTDPHGTYGSPSWNPNGTGISPPPGSIVM